jgi:hypothetical protein
MGPKAHKKAKENNIFGASSTGDTALFNAIDLAADTLEKWSQEYRDAKQDTVSLDAPLLRIFVLSDGVGHEVKRIAMACSATIAEFVDNS